MPGPTDRVPPEGEPPFFGPPFSGNDIQSVFTAVDIYRHLGRLEHAVESLEGIVKSHEEKLEKVAEKLGRVDYSLPAVEGAIPIHAERIRKLERVAHVVEFVVGGSILLLLLHHFMPNLF